MKKQNYFGKIIVILTIFLIRGCSQELSKKEPTKEEFLPELEGCPQIVYESSINVDSKEGVKTVFNNYINLAKENNQGIWVGTNNWKFENTTIHGLYKGVKHWQVNAFYFEDGKWEEDNWFDVSANGEVVRMLGCI